MGLGIERLEFKRPLPPASSLHLWDSCPTAIMSIMGYYSKLASWQKTLHCKHWKYETETSWAAGWWQRGQEVEVRRTARGLERHEASAPLSRPFVCPKIPPLRADKQAPRQSSCRPLWYRENSEVDSQKALLANAMTRRQSLRQELWRLLSFKGNLP